ncbi:MAG: hypothetical protein KGL39_35735, partial [Patescibacteria group bacterium]|nr:hypothetical protein [Patescibacteria group bacterium]
MGHFYWGQRATRAALFAVFVVIAVLVGLVIAFFPSPAPVLRHYVLPPSATATASATFAPVGGWPRSTSARTPNALAAPRRLVQPGTQQGIVWGAYIETNGQFVGPSTNVLTNFNSEIGTPARVVNIGSDWVSSCGSSFTCYAQPTMDYIIGQGATPQYSMFAGDQTGNGQQSAYSDSAIASGTYKSYLTTWFTAAKQWGKPFLLRLMWEMNGNWYPWGTLGGNNGNTDAAYISAWRYIWGIAQSVGATNVYFVYTVNNSSDPMGMYPGDQYVDYVGMDGYNWGNTGGHSFQSPASVFTSTYDALTSGSSRPVIITETSSYNDGTNGQSTSLDTWINSLATTVPTSFPRVVALMWFDAPSGSRNWALDQTSASLSAFQALAKSATFGGTFTLTATGGSAGPGLDVEPANSTLQANHNAWLNLENVSGAGGDPFLGLTIQNFANNIGTFSTSQATDAVHLQNVADSVMSAAWAASHAPDKERSDLVAWADTGISFILNAMNSNGYWCSPSGGCANGADPNNNRFILAPTITAAYWMKTLTSEGASAWSGWSSKLNAAVGYQDCVYHQCNSAYNGDYEWGAGHYANQDVQNLVAFYLGGVLFNNTTYSNDASALMAAIQAYQYPDGGFPYIGNQNEDAVYHSYDVQGVALYGTLSGDARAKAVLAKAAGYEPLADTNEGEPTDWEKPWTKEGYWFDVGTTDCALFYSWSSTVLAAGASGSPQSIYQMWAAMDRQPPQFCKNYPIIAIGYWPGNSAGLGMPDPGAEVDQNLNGLRVRNGQWNAGLTLGRGLRLNFAGGMLTNPTATSPLLAGFDGIDVNVGGEQLSQITNADTGLALEPGRAGALGIRYAPSVNINDIAPESENGATTLANGPFNVQQTWHAGMGGLIGRVDIDTIKSTSSQNVTISCSFAYGSTISGSGSTYTDNGLTLHILSSVGSSSIGTVTGYNGASWPAVNFTFSASGTAGSHYSFAIWLGPSTVTPPSYTALTNEDGFVVSYGHTETAALFNSTNNSETFNVPWSEGVASLWAGTASTGTAVSISGGNASVTLPAQTAGVLDDLPAGVPTTPTPTTTPPTSTPTATQTPIPTPTGQPCPQLWTCQNLGNPSATGSATLNTNGVWSIAADGQDMCNNTSGPLQGYMVTQSLPGDGSVSARVTGVANTSTFARAGVIMALNASNITDYYFVGLRNDGNLHVGDGPESSSNPCHVVAVSGYSAPLYVKAVRTGTSFSAYTSSDGVSWTLVPGSTVTLSDMTGTLLTGMAASSISSGTLGTFSLDNVNVAPAATPTPTSTGVATATPTNTPTHTPTPVPTASGGAHLRYTSIDTMKVSMDSCNNGETPAQITQAVNLSAAQNNSYVTVNTFMDYPAYMAEWVNAVRAAGKHVWFRIHPIDWEGGECGGTATLTPSTYLTTLYNFINANPSLFQAGDILDGCPEPENSPYWNNTYGTGWTNGAPNAATDAYNQFILNVTSTENSALEQNGITGVITTVRSTNGYFAQTPATLYASTASAMGNQVTVDSYPDGSPTTGTPLTNPTTAANDWKNQLSAIESARPGVKIIIGEHGYDNGQQESDATQLAVLQAEDAVFGADSNIIGMNYWVGAGGPGYGGFTNLFTGSPGAWTTRSGAGEIASFYGAHQVATSAPYDWLQFGGGATHSNANYEETTLNSGNVGNLTRLWSTSLPANIDGQLVYKSNVSTSSGTINMLFGEEKDGVIKAFNAATGALVWSAGSGSCTHPESPTQACFSSSVPAIDPNGS